MDVRPTSDRLRETLFNVLGAHDPALLEGSVWLDLYAGTGAVGIEALSRGALRVVFVELSKAAVAALRKNLESLAVKDGFEIVQRDAGKALPSLLPPSAKAEGRDPTEPKTGSAGTPVWGTRDLGGFDVVFLDPPYAEAREYERTLGFLGNSKLLKPESIVIAEHDKRFDPGEVFGGLQRWRQVTQGDGTLSFYKLLAADQRR